MEMIPAEEILRNRVQNPFCGYLITSVNMNRYIDYENDVR